jgi:hypothetical protein
MLKAVKVAFLSLTLINLAALVAVKVLATVPESFGWIWVAIIFLVPCRGSTLFSRATEPRFGRLSLAAARGAHFQQACFKQRRAFS